MVYNNQDANTLSSFCSNFKNQAIPAADIIFLQEHWLTPANMFKILNFSNDYVTYGVSAMDSAVGRSLLKGRPFGGVCTLIKSELSKRVTFSKCCDRVVFTVLGIYLFINCYFPKIYNDSDLLVVQNILLEIEDAIATNPKCHIVLGGDMNVDLNFRNAKSEILLELMDNLSLISCHKLKPCHVN